MTVQEDLPQSPSGKSAPTYFHAMKTCKHEWDGPVVQEKNFGTRTCSKCGEYAINDVWGD